MHCFSLFINSLHLSFSGFDSLIALHHWWYQASPLATIFSKLLSVHILSFSLWPISTGSHEASTFSLRQKSSTTSPRLPGYAERWLLILLLLGDSFSPSPHIHLQTVEVFAHSCISLCSDHLHTRPLFDICAFMQSSTVKLCTCLSGSPPFQQLWKSIDDDASLLSGAVIFPGRWGSFGCPKWIAGRGMANQANSAGPPTGSGKHYLHPKQQRSAHAHAFTRSEMLILSRDSDWGLINLSAATVVTFSQMREIKVGQR